MHELRLMEGRARACSPGAFLARELRVGAEGSEALLIQAPGAGQHHRRDLPDTATPSAHLPLPVGSADGRTRRRPLR